MSGSSSKRGRGGKARRKIDIACLAALVAGVIVLVLVGVQWVLGPPSLPRPQPVPRLERVCFDRHLTYGEIADLYGIEEDLMATILRVNSSDGVAVTRTDPIPGEGCAYIALSPGASASSSAR